jgi:outer membrane protein TolC
MNRILLVLAGVLAAATPAAAQPRIIEIQPPPPSLRTLEESVEQLEAALDVKKAYVKAADVGVSVAKARHTMMSQAFKAGAIKEPDVEVARIEVESALAQLDIRKAEMREVEVKLKQTKKRLDEAKTAPAPAAPPARKPEATAVTDAQIAAAKIKVEKAKATVEAAQSKLDEVKKAAERGIVPQAEYLQAQQGVTVAELDLLVAQSELNALLGIKPRKADPTVRPK